MISNTLFHLDGLTAGRALQNSGMTVKELDECLQIIEEQIESDAEVEEAFITECAFDDALTDPEFGEINDLVELVAKAERGFIIG